MKKNKKRKFILEKGKYENINNKILKHSNRKFITKYIKTYLKLNY